MKILILSTKYTGMGHDSIARALTYEFEKHGTTVKTVEIFDHVWNYVKENARNYTNIVNKNPHKWKFLYDFADTHVNIQAWCFSWGLEKNFYRIIKEFDPDIVISVHPLYVINILNLRKKYAFRFKFVVVIADLISIVNTWIDTRSDLVIIPTVDGAELSGKRNKKMNYLNYVVNMLPIRPQFLSYSKKITLEEIEKPIPLNKELNILLMSGGNGTMESFAVLEDLLNIDKININVVCGKNEEIRQGLLKKYSRDKKKVHLFGFIEDFAPFLAEQDIVIIRASPNAILEALNLCKPIILSSVIYGQELGNIDFVVNNKIGFYCPSKEEIITTVKKLMADDFESFKQIRKNQYNFRKPDAHVSLAENIMKIPVDK
ncbi:galactosyldiacylglycerol synthase [Spirochaetia bacterium]|nr:galactosyldiacylglycerol synthase [Spirochaetia bacterium]